MIFLTEVVVSLLRHFFEYFFSVMKEENFIHLLASFRFYVFDSFLSPVNAVTKPFTIVNMMLVRYC